MKEIEPWDLDIENRWGGLNNAEKEKFFNQMIRTLQTNIRMLIEALQDKKQYGIGIIGSKLESLHKAIEYLERCIMR